MKMKDRVVVITGGAGGIGRITAETFAHEGASVVVADYDQEEGNRVAQELNKGENDHFFIQVNVANSDSVTEMVDQVIQRFGKIDVLINNAGITRDAMLKKLSVEHWQQVLDVNLSGVFYCTKAVLPTMLEQGKGVIINTSSIVGLHGNIGQTNYAATKSGLIGMTKTWAKELGSKGIRVNAVAPGFIETTMVESVPDQVLNKIVESVPLRRLGKPEDIAYAYLFLASDHASYINGTVLSVDGGLII